MNAANVTVKSLEMGASKPSVQKALRITAPGEMKLTENARNSHIKTDEILVQVQYVGPNPVDAKSADLSPSIGARV